uniref:C3H1-type domain-containing protein n=1 Tax=Amblyomma maculatum TaxID=34609 RepID=G3MSA1_AMBMU
MTSLVADYGSSASESEEQNAESSESSDEGGEEEQSKEQSTEKTDRPKLPVPSFQSTTELGSSSVFNNPFREEEAAQSTVLERHVKMTTPVSQQTTVNGKQICWNYRKGRCRFGHNCKYVHDSDVVAPSDSTEEPEPPEPEVVAASSAASGDSASQKRKNKRPGLSDNLHLSKRAMKFYHKTQSKS